MFINQLMIGIISAGLILFLGIIIRKNTNYQGDFEEEKESYSIEHLVEGIKNSFNEILKTNLYDMNLTKEEFDKRMKNRAHLRKALKACTYGDVYSKNYIKSYIRDLLIKIYNVNEENINRIIPFHHRQALDIQTKFDIILYLYKRKYHYKGLEKMIMDYKMDELREIEGEEVYRITEQDIEAIYHLTGFEPLQFEDKLNIIVQRIYQTYKGYGVVDEIRDMHIDGVSGGVSGIPPSFQEDISLNIGAQDFKKLPCSFESVWIFFKGKSIHLAFLSFRNENELIRICKNIYRFNSPGQLSESNGYKVNEMKDGSRIVVARPPFSESWVFFVRKFDSIEKANITDLITDHNKELPIQLIEWLIKGCKVTAITGSQGAGKTTLLMAVVKYINPSFALRIQEMSFELQLRKIYPNRNIVSFRETATISGQEGLNLQKKTDGVVNILGEVAEAGLSSLMIQVSQVASLFTLFTHHAKTTENLIYAIRNNLLQTGIFHNEQIAEQQVIDVLDFDIHLNKSASGHRYIERITEIVPLTKYKDYSEAYKGFNRLEDKMEAFIDNIQDFFSRMTDRKTFETRDIVKYENGTYVIGKPLTEECRETLERHLTKEEIAAFRTFLQYYWGEAIRIE